MVQLTVVPSAAARPMRSNVLGLLALLPLSLSIACVQDAVKPLTVPLQYQAMASPTELVTLPDCAAVSEVIVIDDREDTALGSRANEEDPASVVPVETSSDVSDWVRDGVEETLRTAGSLLGRSGEPVLQIRVERIRTFENVHRRAGYEARISLSAEIVAPGDGEKVCWQGQASGTAGNYGYAGSVENYQETLNHALDRALLSLFDSTGFRDALCEGCE